MFKIVSISKKKRDLYKFQKVKGIINMSKIPQKAQTTFK